MTLPEKTTCPTCGQAVEIHTSDEGTSYFVDGSSGTQGTIDEARPEVPDA